MAGKKRLVRVEMTLKHLRDYSLDHKPVPDIFEVIEILPGQSFVRDIGFYLIKENGSVVRSISVKAGCTSDIKYFYV